LQHANVAPAAERREDVPRTLHISEAQRHKESCGRPVLVWHQISSQKLIHPQIERGVDDSASQVCWRLLRHCRITIPQHRLDGSSKHVLVEAECSLAGTVETKMCAEAHLKLTLSC